MSRNYVLRNVADIYSKPDNSSEVVSQAIYGTVIKILAEDGLWQRITTPDLYSGWIKKDDIIELTRPYPSGDVVAYTKNISNHIYSTDSVYHKPIITLPFGVCLEIIKKQKWIQVRLIDNSTTWVQAGDLSFEKKLLNTIEMVEFSKRFLGLPYTWGGSSSFGFDCSGFTQFLYQQMGLLLPRDAHLQVNSDLLGDVTKENPQTGNLLFFERNDRIYHVGIYIGEGKFIHSTAAEPHGPPVIQISDIRYDSPWNKELAAIKAEKRK